jgi:hypothetical protein
MSTYTLSELNETALEMGKAAIMYATATSNGADKVPVKWSGTTDLHLKHLGHTEGAVRFDANDQIAGLQLPEVYGPGNVKAFVVGAEPTLTAPLFLADPARRDMINPTGDGKIGLPGRRPVKEMTLVAFPQALFFNAATGRHDAKVQYITGTGWRKSATAGADSFAALTADETRLLGLSIWLWNGYWSRPSVSYEATVDNVVKNLEESTFTAMPNFGVLSGVMVTTGSPLAHGIVIDVP